MADVEFPEVNEVVLAVVSKIMPYGAFCHLSEYDVEAFLHVSHVSSGWVKNIHEFLSEGQRLVVKIQRVDRVKNQIDVSLKRVTDDERQRKLSSVKREKKGEKLLEFTIKSSKIKSTIPEIKEKIEDIYQDVLSCFEEASETGIDALKEIDIPKKLKEEIVSFSKERIKKKKIILEVFLKLSCPTKNGVEDVKKVLDVDDIDILYIGAPNYKFTLTVDDYKTGEKKLSKLLDEMESKAKSLGCSLESERPK